MIRHYFLGCPMWAHKPWVGEFFTPNAKPGDFLRQYSAVFNTVEGNNTFYGLPNPPTLLRWREETPPEFRFSFKFPRTITHERRLVDTRDSVREFYRTLAPLAERTGIFFLQLPPIFDAAALPALEKFLTGLPKEVPVGVEFRHVDFFDGGETEARVNELLQRHGVNRVMFDTVVLHAIRTHDPFVIAAQRRKPQMPARFTITGRHPFLRFVGHNEVRANIPHLTRLAGMAAQWIDQGLQPFVFFHAPNDFYAPHLCRAFHQILAQTVTRTNVGRMPPWPAEKESGSQLTLF